MKKRQVLTGFFIVVWADRHKERRIYYFCSGVVITSDVREGYIQEFVR